MIEGLSFPAFRRVATVIMMPAAAQNSAMGTVKQLRPAWPSNRK
jgi:hypothetical protein